MIWLKHFFLQIIVRNFSTLVEGFGNFRLQIRILRVEICLEPDSEVWKPKICFKNCKNKFWKSKQKSDHGVIGRQ